MADENVELEVLPQSDVEQERFSMENTKEPCYNYAKEEIILQPEGDDDDDDEKHEEEEEEDNTFKKRIVAFLVMLQYAIYHKDEKGNHFYFGSSPIDNLGIMGAFLIFYLFLAAFFFGLYKIVYFLEDWDQRVD